MSNDDKKETTETKLTGGFGFGFRFTLGSTVATVLILLAVFLAPNFFGWLKGIATDQYGSIYGPARYSSDPNADNVPPGFYVIKR